MKSLEVSRMAVVPKARQPVDYTNLLKQVKATLLGGQRRIEQERVRIYWETGRLIRTQILKHKDRADYGSEVVRRLSEDLGIGQDILYRCVQFVQKYPRSSIFAARRKFTWSHYRELIKVPDEKARVKFEDLAEGGGWSSNELAARIKDTTGKKATGSRRQAAGRSLNGPFPAVLLSPQRGTLYTYRLIRPKLVTSGASPLVVDLGFSVTRNVPARALANFKDNDIVSSVPKAEDYRFTRADRTSKDLYTYNAFVERVIDGDTLKVHIDLGFDTWTRQTLRLRGIDTPELGTKEGEAAKTFVRSLIKEADRIVIRSSTSDKYDRYLADIFLPAEEGAQDVFLNNLLLTKGLAKRWA